jgi:hypothetical protein
MSFLSVDTVFIPISVVETDLRERTGMFSFVTAVASHRAHTCK